jgi:hypothetical protein
MLAASVLVPLLLPLVISMSIHSMDEAGYGRWDGETGLEAQPLQTGSTELDDFNAEATSSLRFIRHDQSSSRGRIRAEATVYVGVTGCAREGWGRKTGCIERCVRKKEDD